MALVVCVMLPVTASQQPLLRHVLPEALSTVPAPHPQHPLASKAGKAALGYGNLNDNKWLCAGVLVSESYVLTAAPCIRLRDFGTVRHVHLDDVDLTTSNDDEEVVQVIDVDKVTPYPLYQRKAGIARYVDVTEISASQCQKAVPVLSSLGIKVNGSMICAADEAGGRDACRGDSGGPLQVRLDEAHCQFSVAALNSFEIRSCGEPRVPSIYTSISEYLS